MCIPEFRPDDNRTNDAATARMGIGVADIFLHGLTL